MTKRRDRTQIIYDILSKADGTIHKTNLQHKTNLSTQSINRYLKFLLKEELLFINGKYYQITLKGFDYCAKYERLMQLLGEQP